MSKKRRFITTGIVLPLVIIALVCWRNLVRQTELTERGYTPVFNAAGNNIVYVVHCVQRKEKFIYLPIVPIEGPSWTDKWATDMWSEVRETNLTSRETKTLIKARGGRWRLDLRATRGDTLVFMNHNRTQKRYYRWESGERFTPPPGADTVELKIQGETCIFQWIPAILRGRDLPIQDYWRQITPPTGETVRKLERDTGAFSDGKMWYGQPDPANARFVFLRASSDVGGDIWIADIVETRVTVGGALNPVSIYRHYTLKDARVIVDLQNGRNKN